MRILKALLLTILYFTIAGLLNRVAVEFIPIPDTYTKSEYWMRLMISWSFIVAAWSIFEKFYKKQLNK